METLRNALSTVVGEAAFDLECAEIAYDGRAGRPSSQSVSAADLRTIYHREKDRSVKLYANARAPDASMAMLADALRRALEQFVHPDTDKIGHAFPVDGSDYSRETFRSDGLLDCESWSPVSKFAGALVRAAAIMGVEKALGLLAAWKSGKAVRLRMCAVLNGLPLNAPVSPHDDIRIVPLPLTTAELPRLPVRRDVALQDYLGLSLFTIHLSASPALFRPDPGAREGSVRCSAAAGVNLDLACEALSLHTGGHVSPSFAWHEYPDAAAFCLEESGTWGPCGDDRLRRRHWKELSHDLHTGVAAITPSEQEPPLCPDEEELRWITKALPGADKELRIALDRWHRSMHPGARLEDRYIDLRVALEALYLKEFDDERSQEMRFRLALFGAWHLADGLEQRKSVRKTLRDAYDIASKVVHGGEVLKKPRGDLFRKAIAELARAQDLCRRGMLKLLREGPPIWGDLILGGPAS